MLSSGNFALGYLEIKRHLHNNYVYFAYVFGKS